MRYLLNYIDDEDYRGRILRRLNRKEGRHAVARAIYYGQGREIRKHYLEGQEDQLGALGLVTNSVVLWNTLYMQEDLSRMRSHAEEIGDKDITRFSPTNKWVYQYAGALCIHATRGYSGEKNEGTEFNLNNELFYQCTFSLHWPSKLFFH